MDYRNRIENALTFIENNLKEPLSLELIAGEAFFSKYHFTRIFAAITGETVGDYVRKRRLTESAHLLIKTDESILSIAQEYQFESQEAYTRSFKLLYQMTPGAYRKKGVNQLAFQKPKLTAQHMEHLKERITAQPEIVELKPKKLVGMNTRSSKKDKNIAALWQNFMSRFHEIENKGTDRYGVHPFDSELEEGFDDNTAFERWATVEVSDFDNIPDGMEKHELQGGKYAKFIHRSGFSDFGLSMNYIYGTWLPKSGEELDQRDDFERYTKNFLGPEHPDSEIEIFIPIK